MAALDQLWLERAWRGKRFPLLPARLEWRRGLPSAVSAEGAWRGKRFPLLPARLKWRPWISCGWKGHGGAKVFQNQMLWLDAMKPYHDNAPQPPPIEPAQLMDVSWRMHGNGRGGGGEKGGSRRQMGWSNKGEKEEAEKAGWVDTTGGGSRCRAERQDADIQCSVWQYISGSIHLAVHHVMFKRLSSHLHRLHLTSLALLAEGF